MWSGKPIHSSQWRKQTDPRKPTLTYAVPMTLKLVLTPTNEETEDVITPDKFPYRTVVGATLWASNVRPDLAQPIRQLARFGLKPSKKHVEAAVHMLRYAYIAKDVCLRYSGHLRQVLPLDEEDSSTSNATLGLNHYTATHYGGKVYKAHEGKFVDASMYRALKGVDPPEAGKIRIEDDAEMHDVDASHSMYYDASFQSTFDYKSVSGHVAMCGGAAVDWGSHTQSVVATSTCEAEVLATVRGTQQLIHIKTLLEEFDIASPLEPTLSFEDNKAARIILGTPGRRKGAKHYERTLHKMHQFSKDGYVKLIYCRTSDQLADIFTKPLDAETFLKFRKVIFNEPDQ